MTAYFLIRLDDACPTMNHKNWLQMETLLDQYAIKPIVGIIPDNRDSDFNWPIDPHFWDRAILWQKKGWTIAVHGLHHEMHAPSPGAKYFQKSHSVHTEFAGLPRSHQLFMLQEGVNILHSKGIFPSCFFAPAHTYDVATVEAVKQMSSFNFISDGYALNPYIENGMTFIPSICDGPFWAPFGIYTYVFHPSMMSENRFQHLAKFLSRYHAQVITSEQALTKVQQCQGFTGHLLEIGCFSARKIRKMVQKR